MAEISKSIHVLDTPACCINDIVTHACPLPAQPPVLAGRMHPKAQVAHSPALRRLMLSHASVGCCCPNQAQPVGSCAAAVPMPRQHCRARLLLLRLQQSSWPRLLLLH